MNYQKKKNKKTKNDMYALRCMYGEYIAFIQIDIW